MKETEKIIGVKTEEHENFEKLNNLENRQYLFVIVDKDSGGMQVTANCSSGILTDLIVHLIIRFPGLSKSVAVGMLEKMATRQGTEHPAGSTIARPLDS